MTTSPEITDLTAAPEPWAAVGARPHPRRPPASRRWLAGSLATLAVVGAGVGGGWAGASLAPFTHSSQPGTAPVAVSSTTVASTSEAVAGVADVVAVASPGVVSVTVSSDGSQSQGSGFVLTGDGLILTAAHVVDASSGATITVTRSDRESTTATLVGADTAADIAVLRVDGWSDLTPLTAVSADELAVGDTVIAIGSPLGLSSTVTTGIVSALHRDVEIGDATQQGPFAQSAVSSTTLSDLIQTDAAVNPGNSGGPLLDAAGRVVGVVTAMASIDDTSGSIGLGFAIPIDTALQVAEGLAGADWPSV